MSELDPTRRAERGTPATRPTLRCPDCTARVCPAEPRGGIAFWWCAVCRSFSQRVWSRPPAPCER